MENIETGQFLGALFLILIILMMVLSFGRKHVQRTLQHASIWALIFVGAVAAFGIWTDIQQDLAPRQAVFAQAGRVEIPRARDGHYYVTLEVNGAPVEFVVDTGATGIVLTQEDAERAGLGADSLRFFGRAQTANGEVRTAPVRLDEMAVGGIVDRNVAAYVNEGDLFQSLLGIAYLDRWDKLEISGGTMVLTRN